LVDLLRLEELDSVTLTVDAADADTTDDGRTAVLVSEQGQRLVLVDAAGPKLSFARDVALPFAPRDVDVTAHGFALVTAATQSTVASVDVATGTLVDSVGLTGVATAVAAHPNGDLALATSADGRVHAARIAADGKLTLLTPSVATGGASPSNVLFAPGGTFALVTHTSSNTVGVVDVDATGALTARAPVDIGAPSQSLTFHPAGDRAFVYNPRQGTVRVLVVDAGGNVSYPGVPITGLRTDGVANAGVDQIAATTDGRFVLVHEPNRCIVLDAMQPRILALLGHYDNLGAGGVTPLGR
jgi:DNA-binding beta-propeller fold protein YncE